MDELDRIWQGEVAAELARKDDEIERLRAQLLNCPKQCDIEFTNKDARIEELEARIDKLRMLLQECWDDVGDFMEIDLSERVKREIPEP